MPLLAPHQAANCDVDLSVVILNWNARDYLVAALRSILQQQWRHAIELIVVDNFSQLDDSAEVVRRDFPEARLIVTDRNLGFAAGNNIGLRAARGKYILFLNPDTIVHDGAFDILLDWMEAHPRAGACGPKMTYPDGRLQASSRAFPSFGAGLFRNTIFGKLWPSNPWSRSYLMEEARGEQPSQADWLSGSALLARRTALEEIKQKSGDNRGAWDEDYFMYCEDVDLCWRLKAAGWERWYVPAAHITHRIGASSDWAQGAMIRQHHGAMLRFYFKNYAKSASGVLLAPLAVAGIGARALGAVAKLWWRYVQSGRAGVMLKRKMGKQ
jgi:GT2 family glycosyltransferase